MELFQIYKERKYIERRNTAERKVEKSEMNLLNRRTAFALFIVSSNIKIWSYVGCVYLILKAKKDQITGVFLWSPDISVIELKECALTLLNVCISVYKHSFSHDPVLSAASEAGQWRKLPPKKKPPNLQPMQLIRSRLFLASSSVYH